MTVTNRVIPIITVDDIDSERNNYAEVLELVEVMDHGWILTLADVSGGQQISLMTRDPTAPIDPRASIKVEDIDAAFASARAKGLDIVHGPRDESWGVRRFFFRDRSGNVINVLSHRTSPV